MTIAVSLLLLSPIATAAELCLFSDPSGLSAEAEFALLDPTTLEVRFRNTSEGVPADFSNADQILTTLSWDFGAPGIDDDDPAIIGGSVVTGPASYSINFDIAVGPGDDVSGEYGYGNSGATGLLPNILTATRAHAVAFGGANLLGPINIDGPAGGLVSDPVLVPIGGLGGIQNEIVAVLILDRPLADLSFLTNNPVRVEFGSDAAYVPEPVTMSLVTLGGCLLLTCRSRRHPSASGPRRKG